MSNLDWFVLIFTILFIVIYGVWKTRGSHNLQSYLKGDNDAKWWGIGIRIEDDILITEGEPINLSSSAPKTIEEIETLMREESAFDKIILPNFE